MAKLFGDVIELYLAIVVVIENGNGAHASLRDVVWETTGNHTANTWHGARLIKSPAPSQEKCIVSPEALSSSPRRPTNGMTLPIRIISSTTSDANVA
jgi:hypothetical protein